MAVKVVVQYRGKDGKVKSTRPKICKDKAAVALFVNKYVRKGTFVGFTQTEA